MPTAEKNELTRNREPATDESVVSPRSVRQGEAVQLENLKSSGDVDRGGRAIGLQDPARTKPCPTHLSGRRWDRGSHQGGHASIS